MRIMAKVIAVGIWTCMPVFATDADQAAVAPPERSVPLLEVVADGVQIYNCDVKEGRFEWSFRAPEAILFDKEGRQVGTHFAGPTWKMSDGSAVVGEVIARADAPDPGGIQWLLLRAKNHEGSGILSAVAYIRRTETKGGIAPKTGCDARHTAEQARMRYSAIYQFLEGKKSP
jgi:hypothetical protein